MKKGGNKYYKIYIFIIFVFILNLTMVRQVFCYDSNIAHPGIAELAVKQYNQNNSQKISVDQLNWIKSGTVKEDEPTRWLNHFYDPIYDRGLWFGIQHDSAKVWAKNSNKQTTFSQGDNSWQRAINDYRKGNTELAFKELGHSIHLVSDMLVPAHTRDSIHATPPDSYEQYVKNTWEVVSKDLKGEVVNKNSLEEIFDEAAKYSNGNFYSDKTIEDKKYKLNKISSLEPYIFNDKVDLYIALIKDSENNIIKSYLTGGSDWKSDKNSVNNSLILSSYASHLLPKAVAYSANTIKLFLAETQKIEKEKLPFFRVSLGGLVNNGVGSMISVAENLYDYASGQTSDGQIISIPSTKNKIINSDPNANLVVNENLISNPVAVTNKITNPILKNNVIDIEQIKPLSSSVVQPPVDNIVDNSNKIDKNNNNSNTKIPTSNFFSGGSSSQVVSTPVVTEAINIVVSTSTIVNPTSTLVENISTTTINQESATTTMEVTSTAIFTTTSTVISTSTEETVLATTTIISTTTPDVASTTTDIVTTTVFVTTSPSITTTTITTTTEILPPLPSAPDVVINEIAWAGTSATTDQDEFIELYNNTDQDIVLFSTTNTAKQWKLMIGNNEISISKFNNRVIPKNGYYLFERTDDRTVNGIAADIIYTGALKNSGERLRLLDGNGQLVDEVDNSAGWFAGSAITYNSMEKINSRLSGNTSTNWQTNIGPRLEGMVDNGGDAIPLNGSPKQSNFGSVVIKTTQAETERTLKKSDYPYFLSYYEIPAGKTLNIDAGVVIKSMYLDSKIDVKGKININGTTDDRVVMTSGRDISFTTEKNNVIVGSRLGSLQAKDWQGFMFYTSSTANIYGLDMRFAGRNFKAPNANFYDALVSQAVRSDGATLNIDNSIFSDNGDTSIYTKQSNLVIKNSIFKNGILAVENYDGNLELENVNFDNFSNANGPVYIKNIWPKMSQINFNNNINNNIAIDQAVITTNTIITKDIPMVWQNIVIEPGVTVDVSAGTNIKMSEYSNLTVKGTLNLNGNEDNPISITPTQSTDNFHWGRIIFDGGKGSFQNANISGGRGSTWNDQFEGMLVVNNSELDLFDCQLLGSRAPGNSMEINNSTVGINNSAIGFIGSKPNFDNTNGIKINSGELMLNNTNLMNLDTGIINRGVQALPSLYLNNMDSRNFMNVKTFWDPLIWFPAFTI